MNSANFVSAMVRIPRAPPQKGRRNVPSSGRGRKNRRALPHRLERCGYVSVQNPDNKQGVWVLKGERQVVYDTTIIANDLVYPV